MFSKALGLTLNMAFARAKEQRHEFMTVELLLLTLLDNPEAIEVLVACGADLQRLRNNLENYIQETASYIPSGHSRETQPTLGFQRVLQRAIFQVQSSGQNEVTGANVIAAIFSEQESQAVYFLNQESVTRLDVMNYISHGISKTSGESSEQEGQAEAGPQQQAGAQAKSAFDTQGGESALDKYTSNLNELAKQGKIDPVIGRENEIQRAVQILSRRSKNNPLLVGEAGVGKTAIAEGLATYIVNGDVPGSLKDSSIFALDLGVMLAGTKYRGDFEKRFKGVLNELEQMPGSILFIDEIHTLIGAGAAAGGAMDASNLIKPLLTQGNIRCMGATTYSEFRSIFEKDRALTRRFQKIDIKELSRKQTYEVLKGLKNRFESHHNVRYSYSALKKAADLAARYLPDRHLPDKAIDVVDEAGAYQRMKSNSKQNRRVTRRDVEMVVSKMARVPSESITTSEKEILKHLEGKLKSLVYGQDEAIGALASAIKLSRSGLREQEKPVGNFLFTGPTGVGKTEVSQQLAKVLGLDLVRFDMSEYMESHTVSRLIGSPPGYVGYEQGGVLTETINKKPHCVLLLDEIEKAHQDIYNLLLQIMDYGRLTDNNGRTTDFRNVILIMTSNVGAAELEKRSVGFTSETEQVDSSGAIKTHFSPEFRNRLDQVIQFNHLNEEVVKKVVDKFVTQVEVQLENKGVELEVEPSARQWLAHHGYDINMGARPMERLIQEKVKQPLADELLFGKLSKGGKVVIDVDNDELVFHYHSKEVQQDTS